MSESIIRKASLSDLSALQKIAIATFTDAFADFNSQGNMESYIEKNFSVEKLTRELQNPDSAFFLALEGIEVSGYMKINSGDAQNELKESPSMELGRIYVIRRLWGKGVADLLCSHAIATARETRKSFLWLGVWEQNYRAIRFYQKHGFVEFDKHTFILGTDVQTDLMMKLEIY